MTNKDEDQDWLNALAGKPNPDADPDVTRRATLLRQAIQRHNTTFEPSEFDTEASLQKLKFRVRREGLLDAAPYNELDMPAVMRTNKHRESTKQFNEHRFNEFSEIESPALFISNLKKEYFSFFWIFNLPKTISEMERIGLDIYIANRLLHFMARGIDEEVVVASFLYAFSQTVVGESFGRSFKYAIHKRWKQVVKTHNIDSEMERALGQVTLVSWSWQLQTTSSPDETL